MAGHVAGEKNEVKLLPVDGWWCTSDTAGRQEIKSLSRIDSMRQR